MYIYTYNKYVYMYVCLCFNLLIGKQERLNFNVRGDASSLYLVAVNYFTDA